MSAADTRELFRGRREARAVLLDVPLIGSAPARARVLRLWQPGSRLLQLSDGRWLLVLAESISARAEYAPGLLVEVTADGPEASVELVRHGERSTVRLADLAPVDLTGWVDLGDLPIHLLAPVESAPPAPVRPREPVRPAVDLRAKAGAQRDPADRADRRTARMVEEISALGAAPAPAGPFAGWLARTLSRTPGLSPALGRRHRAYLRRLTEQFAAGEFDAALRGAIALGGSTGRLSVRLPVPRSGALRPATGARHGGGRALLLAGLDQHLRPLYQQAARDLERQGRIEEAAFARADLLGDVKDAVDLLERHAASGSGRLELAAELAQSRGLPPEIAVRLWWRAGRRDLAVRLAVARGAFAGAVAALAARQPESARELRAVWARSRHEAGDHLGAVLAAWPDTALRRSVLPDVEAGIAGGGPAAGELLALMVTHRPTEAALDLADGLLATPDPRLAAARARFVATLASEPVADPAADRRLATHALRSLLRDRALDAPAAAGQVGAEAAARAERALRSRADPLAAADLPKVRFGPAPHGDLHVRAAGPGGVAVLDAVQLPAGLLVALGPLGVRLLGPDGRVRARWPVPTDSFVVADHGGTVLLASRGERIVDLHRLDLAARRIRHWSTLELHSLVDSFDGGTMIGQDDDGLVFLDTTAEAPVVVWRELGPGTAVAAITRSPSALSALVFEPAAPDLGPQIWTWSLPDLRLRARRRALTQGMVSAALRADGALLAIDTAGELHLQVAPAESLRPQASPGPGQPAGVLAAGDRFAVLTPTEEGLVVDLGDAAANPLTGAATITLPAPAVGPGVEQVESPSVRIHAAGLTVADRQGRGVAVDLATRTLTATLLVHP